MKKRGSVRFSLSTALAIVLTGGASAASADAILTTTAQAFSSAKTLGEVGSIEQWCRASLRDLNYGRDSFLLHRAMSLSDQSKSTSLVKTVVSLDTLDDQEFDLLCKPDALQ